MNIWITSDSHYSHKNIVGPEISSWKDGFRDFKTLHQMNETLVTNINKFVAEEDILYHLGDFAFGSKNKVIEFRSQLLCKNIHLIYGNHDEEIEKSKELQALFSSTQHVYNGYIGKTKFHLSHYPHLSWNGSHKGTIMLHGHEHGKFNHLNMSCKRFDVGIDCHKDFRPYHINEILSISKEKEIVKHH